MQAETIFRRLEVEPQQGIARGWLAQVLSVDQALLVAVRRLEGPAGTRVARLLTRVGDTSSWFFHLVIMGVLLGAQCAIPATMGALFAIAIIQVLKRVCRRLRPNQAIPGFTSLAVNPDAFSFPSGHTGVAFGAAVALLAVDPTLAIGELLLAYAIGFSRVYLGAHYPLDVTIGAVLGILSGIGAALLVG